MDFSSLSATNTLSDSISLCELDGITLVRVHHPKASAAISLFGGQILSFKPANSADILWMSTKTDYSGNTPLRGGIPLCWPWFGKVASPSHGFARTSIWTLSHHSESEKGVIIHLSLNDSKESKAIWDHSFKLELVIEMTDTLSVKLITTNTGKTSFSFGGALHTYLTVGDIERTKICQLGASYIEKNNCFSANGVTDINQEVDRIYTQPDNTIIVKDKSFEREIKVTNEGNTSVVVWNPWISLCQSMQDMDEGSYQTMICVESCIHEQSITLAPKGSHTLSTHLSC